jgi:hypothetical protein
MNGGAGGGLNFYWYDGFDPTTHEYNSALADNKAQLDELFWYDYQGGTRSAFQVFPSGTWNEATDPTRIYNTPVSPSGQSLYDMSRYANWSGYDPQEPLEQTDPLYRVDPNWSSNKTMEVIATVEREIFTDLRLLLISHGENTMAGGRTDHMLIILRIQPNQECMMGNYSLRLIMSRCRSLFRRITLLRLVKARSPSICIKPKENTFMSGKIM